MQLSALDTVRTSDFKEVFHGNLMFSWMWSARNHISNLMPLFVLSPSLSYLYLQNESINTAQSNSFNNPSSNGRKQRYG